MILILILAAGMLAMACGPAEEPQSQAVAPTQAPAPPAFDDARGPLDPRLVTDLKRVPEVFRTEPLSEDKDIDSLAVWHRGEATPWLLATQKDSSYVLVLDAATGELLERLGGEGEDLGKLGRPNGIAVIDDLVLLVEQKNQRVQVLRLPEFEPVGAFGEGLLKRPYGLAVDHPGDWYEVYVTDSFDSPEHEPPAPETCANRVRHYRFRLAGEGLEAELVRSFGEPTGDGALYRVESLVIDRPLSRLYIADESRQRLNHKVYSTDGEFLGKTFGDGLHYYEPEGVALVRCGSEEPPGGYVIAADQTQPTRFLVFSRESLDKLGGFTGEPAIDITDGITFAALNEAAGGGHMLYATHHDVQVVAYRWSDIAQAMGLSTDCR
jgi:3-phytase